MKPSKRIRESWRKVRKAGGEDHSKKARGSGAYLEKERGLTCAALILENATGLVSVLQSDRPNRASRLSSRERARAIKAARTLKPLMQRDVPQMASLMDSLMRRWGSAVPARGRKKGPIALFANVMLHWGAGRLGAMGKPNLTVTELIAAAVEAGLSGVTWEDRRDKLRSWCQVYNTNRPSNPEQLKAETLEQMRADEAKSLRQDSERFNEPNYALGAVLLAQERMKRAAERTARTTA